MSEKTNQSLDENSPLVDPDKRSPMRQILKRNGITVKGDGKGKIEQPKDATERRRRSSNFHYKEIEYLLWLLDSNKFIIECKRTDQSTNATKDQTWKSIARIFNQRNITKRSDKQLRSKWETLKKIARKEYTSGNVSTISNTVLKIMLSYNDTETKYKSENFLRLKEEPFFDCANEQNWCKNFKEVNTISQTKTIPSIKTSSSEYLEEVNSKLQKKLQGSDNLEISSADQSQKSISFCNNQGRSPVNSLEDRLTKATQCNIQDFKIAPRRKKLRFVDTRFRRFGGICFKKDDKRKEEKHNLKMAILKIELSIKKRQLEILER